MATSLEQQKQFFKAREKVPNIIEFETRFRTIHIFRCQIPLVK